MNTTTGAVALLVTSVMFMGAYGEQSQSQESEQKAAVTDEKQPEFENLDDRFSYAYGVDMAEKFKAEGVELNTAMLAAGMQDVYGGGEKKMSTDEIAATLELYFKMHRQRKEEERAAAGEKNKKEGKKFLAENAKKKGVVVTESGLQYKVITAGTDGQQPKEDDVVTMHYRGSLVDGTEFGNTYQRDEPFSGKVKRLVPGWAEALQMMSEGSKWELYIPADIAYGERGSDPDVGPNATLIFEVELLEIEKGQ